MKSWEDMLASFRQLGGVSDNLRLGDGKYGRGLFPIDKTKPVKLQVPKHLLVPVEWLEINELGELGLASSCDWDEDVKSFYLTYLMQYSLTPTLVAELMNEQQQLFNLTASIKGMLINYGVDHEIFAAPNYQSVLNKFKRSRQIIINEKLFLMPVVELVNHSDKSRVEFKDADFVGFYGQFKDEVLVNYGVQADAIAFHNVYGFSEVKSFAFSGTASLNLGPVTLNIARLTKLSRSIAGVKTPRMRFNGEVIDLSFLLLVNNKNRAYPKFTFVQMMQHVGMPKEIANEIFDGLIEQNINFLKNLLIELEPISDKIADGLKLMVKNQLATYGVFR